MSPDSGDDRRRKWLLERLEPTAQAVLRFWRSVFASTAKKLVVLVVSAAFGIGAVTGALAVSGALQIALLGVSVLSIGVSVVVLATSRLVRSLVAQQEHIKVLEADNLVLREAHEHLTEAHTLSEQLRELAEGDGAAEHEELLKIVRYAVVAHDIARSLSYLHDHPEARPAAAAFIDDRCLAAAANAIAEANRRNGAPRPHVELALVRTEPTGYTVVDAGRGQSFMTHGTCWLEPERSLKEVVRRNAQSEFHPEGGFAREVNDEVWLVVLSDVPLGAAEVAFLERHLDQIDLTIKTLKSLGME
jgi:hypothetical protein